MAHCLKGSDLPQMLGLGNLHDLFSTMINYSHILSETSEDVFKSSHPPWPIPGHARNSLSAFQLRQSLGLCVIHHCKANANPNLMHMQEWNHSVTIAIISQSFTDRTLQIPHAPC